jgi:hypothetical protein
MLVLPVPTAAAIVPHGEPAVHVPLAPGATNAPLGSAPMHMPFDVQSVYPESHANPHWPPMHVGMALATEVVHTWLQLPQLLRSPVVSTHSVGVPAGHAVRPAAHTRVHAPPLHAGVPDPTLGPGHTESQLPQLFGSLCSSTHRVGFGMEHALYPALHVKVHALLAHAGCPFATPPHALPHVPQLFGSVVVFVHVPPQNVGAGAPQPVEHA